MTAKRIVEKLVQQGRIPEEFKEDATRELHRELRRRSCRTAQSLARLVSQHQMALRYAHFTLATK